MVECKVEENKEFCNCTYECGKHGMCCTCLRSHIRNNEVPGCFFPPEDERTYDRSVENFIRVYKQRGRIG